VLPMMPGVLGRQAHDYVRYGTTRLFAALDINYPTTQDTSTATGWTFADHPGEVSPDGMQRLLRRAEFDVAYVGQKRVTPWSTGNCRQAGIPDTVPFATKPRIALAMLRRAIDACTPFGWVAADEAPCSEVETDQLRPRRSHVTLSMATHALLATAKTLAPQANPARQQTC
jgi:hypothetical protein